MRFAELSKKAVAAYEEANRASKTVRTNPPAARARTLQHAAGIAWEAFTQGETERAPERDVANVGRIAEQLEAAAIALQAWPEAGHNAETPEPARTFPSALPHVWRVLAVDSDSGEEWWTEIVFDEGLEPRIRDARRDPDPFKTPDRNQFKDNARRQARSCPKGMEIQTLILEKPRFDVPRAKLWVRKHGFKLVKIHETASSIRVRQHSPGRYDRSSFRTITLKPFVKAVVGCPKRTAKPSRDTSQALKLLHQASRAFYANDFSQAAKLSHEAAVLAASEGDPFTRREAEALRRAARVRLHRK